MSIAVGIARPTDSAAIGQVHAAAAEELVRRFGKGPWSSVTSEQDVARAIGNPHQRVLVARSGRTVVGTVTLQTRKPWAIDVSYFTPVEKPIYLVNMAVQPSRQGTGIGRRMLRAAENAARQMGGGAIRLDAYDAEAGAGPFYRRCGYRSCGRRSYRGNPLVYFELILATSRNDGETQRSQRGRGRRGSAMK